MTSPNHQDTRSGDVLGSPDHVVVVGGGEVGRSLATRLAADYRVTLVDEAPNGERGDPDGVDVHSVDLADGQALRSLELGAHAAVVLSERDRVNLLAAGLLRSVCDVGDVVARVNDPANRAAFESIGVEVFCASTLLAETVAEALDDI